MSLFQTSGDGFPLHSGARSGFKIECGALDDADLHALAVLVASRFHWRRTVGVLRGGIRFAEALDEFSVPNPDLPTLIVDDVLTTGRSMEQERSRRSETSNAIGVVIFARSAPAEWIYPLFQLWPSA